MSQNALKSFLVFSDDGKVNRQATNNKFQEALTKFELNQKDRQDLIEVAIGSVFDQYKGQYIIKDALITLTLKELHATPNNWNDLHKEIVSHLKANTGSNLSLYGSKGGQGFWRWADKCNNP